MRARPTRYAISPRATRSSPSSPLSRRIDLSPIAVSSRSITFTARDANADAGILAIIGGGGCGRRPIGGAPASFRAELLAPAERRHTVAGASDLSNHQEHVCPRLWADRFDHPRISALRFGFPAIRRHVHGPSTTTLFAACRHGHYLGRADGAG